MSAQWTPSAEEREAAAEYPSIEACGAEQPGHLPGQQPQYCGRRMGHGGTMHMTHGFLKWLKAEFGQ